MREGELSVKLSELDKKFGQLYGRIAVCGRGDCGRLGDEIAALRRECEENGRCLREELSHSRASVVPRLKEAYAQLEKSVGQFKAEDGCKWREGLTPEDKLLAAEYALDFAIYATDHALLISMEAIEAQLSQQEKEETE